MSMCAGLAGNQQRGQAIQIGALLLFTILLISLSSFQLFVVPDQNAEIEFKHSQQIRNQLVDYRSAVIRASSGGGTQAVSVSLAPSYPSRALFLNPAPPSGTLQSVGTSDSDIAAAFENVRALDPEAREYWNGTVHRFGTGALEYRPGYNYYGTAPTVAYENTVLYSRFGDAPDSVLNGTGQLLVNGRRISLVALQGDYQRSGQETVSVSAFPSSASEERIAVTNSSGERVTVTIPTRLPAEQWNRLLTSQFNPNAELCGTADTTSGTLPDEGRYVDACTYSEGDAPGEFAALELRFERGVTYELKLSKVTFGENEVADFGYITQEDGFENRINEGGSLQIVARTHDEFGNPASGVPLTAAVTSSTGALGTITPADTVTGDEGRARFVYDPADDDNDQDGNVKDETVTVTICRGAGGDCSTATPTEKFSVNFTVVDDDTGQGAGGGDDPGQGRGPQSIAVAPEQHEATRPAGRLIAPRAAPDTQ
ncbi:MAG: hypothetical protein ABEJ05_03370 [Haloglomus sp.]